MKFIKEISKQHKERIKDYILFEFKNYALLGLYSKKCYNPIKRKFYYLPVDIIKFI